MITFLTVLQILSCALIIALILLQPAKQGASAFSATPGPMGSSAGSTPLFKITMFLAAFLMLSSIIVSRYRIQESNASMVDSLKVDSIKKTDDPVVDLTKDAAAPSNATTNSTTAPSTAPGAAPTPAKPTTSEATKPAEKTK
jgi:protein translocase SecG subunit